MRNERIHPISNPALLRTRHSLRRWITWDDRLPDDVVAALWERPERLLQQGECLQTKTRTTVAKVELAGRSYLLKFHHWAGFWKTLSKSRAVSPNRFSFDLGVQLADGGVRTPRPLACIDVRLGPLNICSYLLTEYVEGTSLYRTMRFDRHDAALVDDYARQVAQIWQLLDDMKLSHNDLKPENFMIDHDRRVWLIDLENARWHNDPESLRRCQLEDAKRLMHVRSWRNAPAAAEQFRQRLAEMPSVQAAIAEAGGTTHPLACPTSVDADASQRLTVLIACRNAANEVYDCVEHVRDFADEILVSVSGSNDGTWNVVKSLTGCLAIRFDRSDTDTQQRAIAAARHPWVLVVEPAERISPDLAKEIQFLLAGNPADDAFRIERRHHLFGRPLRFGDFVGDMPVRLVRRDGAVLPTTSGSDEASLPKAVGKLRGRIFHYRAWTVEEWISELTEHASDAALKSHASGKRASFARIPLHVPLRFLQTYFVKLGCLDGRAGLHAAFMSAVFQYVEYAKPWQLQHGVRRPDLQTSEIHCLGLMGPDALCDSDEGLSEPNAASHSHRAAA